MIKDELIVMLEMAIEENKFERDAFLFSTDIYQEGYLTEAANSTGDSVFKRLIERVKELIQKLKQKITTWYQSSVVKQKIDNIKKVLDKNPKAKNQKINVKNNNALVKFQNDTLRKLRTSKNPDKDMEAYDKEKVKIAKKIAIGTGVAVTLAAFIGGYAIYNKNVNEEIRKTEDDIRDIEEKYGQFKHDKISEEKSNENILNKKRYLASLRVHRDKLSTLNQDITTYVEYSTKIDGYLMDEWKGDSIYGSVQTGNILFKRFENGDRYDRYADKKSINDDYAAKDKARKSMPKDSYIKTLSDTKINAFKDYKDDMAELTSAVERINKNWNQLFS